MLGWVLVCGRALAVGRIEWPLRTARVTEHVHAAHCGRLVPYPKPLPTVFKQSGPPNGGRGSHPWSSFGQRGETYAPSAVGKRDADTPPPSHHIGGMPFNEGNGGLKIKTAELIPVKVKCIKIGANLKRRKEALDTKPLAASLLTRHLSAPPLPNY